MNLSKIKTCTVTLNIESLGTNAEKDLIARVIPSVLEEPFKAKVMFFTAFKYVNSEGIFKNPKLALKFSASFKDGGDIMDFLNKCYTYLRGAVHPGSFYLGKEAFKEVEKKVNEHVDGLTRELTYMYNESSPGFIRTEMKVEESDQVNMITRDFPSFIYNLSKWGRLDTNPTDVTVTLRNDERKKIYITVGENLSKEKKTPISVRVVVEFKEKYFNDYRQSLKEDGSTSENDSIFDDIYDTIGIDEDTFNYLQADDCAWILKKEIE